MLGWGLLLASRLFGALSVTGLGLGAVTFGVVCAIRLVSMLCSFFFLSMGTFRAWLVEHGAYELLLETGGVLLWYVLAFGCQARCFVFTVRSLCSGPSSLEQFFRNARWLEREAGEMLDV